MLKEREIAELIFDAFRQTNCRAGHIVMMRVFRFGIELKLNPIEKDMYFCVLNGLINLGYFTYESGNIECLRLTEKGYYYIYDDEKVGKMHEVPWLLPAIDNPNWDRTFNRFYNILNDENNKYNLEWHHFFEWINAYSARPIADAEQAAILRTKANQKERAEALINQLPNNNARMSFYLSAQNFCEQSVLRDE